MKHSIARTTLAALAVAVAVVIPTASAKPTPSPHSAYFRALSLRGEALNHLYGVDSTSHPDPAYVRALNLRSEALNRVHAVDPIRARHDAMNRLFAETPYERALRLRGEGLNNAFGSSSSTAVRPDDRGGIRAVGPVGATQSSPAGFDWRDAALGALGAAGLALVVGAGPLVALRVAHQRRERVAAV